MRCIPIVLALSLAACQSAPVVYDVPQRQSYDRDTESVWFATLDALDGAGLTITEANQVEGHLVAVLIDDQSEVEQPKSWAACKPARVIDRHDDKNRRNRGRPVDRQVEVDLKVAESAAGSDVRIRSRFTERQINPFRNLPFQVACPSTGELERQLFAAIAKTGS